jgi:dihydroorotase-like cyclic amidohydrolase
LASFEEEIRKKIRLEEQQRLERELREKIRMEEKERIERELREQAILMQDRVHIMHISIKKVVICKFHRKRLIWGD